MPRATTAATSATARKAGARAGASVTARKSTAKAPAKSAPAKQVAAKKAVPVAKKAPAKKAAPVAKKAPAKKAVPVAKKAPAKKAAPVKSAPAKKTAAKKTPAKAAPKPPTRRKPTAAELKFFEVQRLALIDERATYLRQAESLKAEADSLAEQREPGDVQFDEESGEGDTLAVERERDLALSAQARAAIEEIDHALAKIDTGTYGICEVSGLAIPRERLKAIPWARERVEYKVGSFGRR